MEHSTTIQRIFSIRNMFTKIKSTNVVRYTIFFYYHFNNLHNINMMSDKFRLNMNNKKSYYNLSVWENNRIWYVGMVTVLYHLLLHCMQLPSFHDYLVFVMTQVSKNLNFVEIPTTSVGASPDLDSDSMGESESESRLGLYPCGLRLDSTLVD